MNTQDTTPMSAAALELGLITSSLLQYNGGGVDHSNALWPYIEGVEKIGGPEALTKKYASYAHEVQNQIAHSKLVRQIVIVGYDAVLVDMIVDTCKGVNVIIIPNALSVNVERMAKNYDETVQVLDPYLACTRLGIDTLILVPYISLSDGQRFVYSYARRFLGCDVARGCFAVAGCQLLKIGLDYRNSHELSAFSKIEENFDIDLTF